MSSENANVGVHAIGGVGSNPAIQAALEAVRKSWIVNELKAKTGAGAPPQRPQRPTQQRGTKDAVASGAAAKGDTVTVRQTSDTLRTASGSSSRAEMPALPETNGE